MAIFHKFIETDFGNGYKTHNAILDTIPSYIPEVMFVGTNNPMTPLNFADFFYGRNFLWPALMNIFVYNRIYFKEMRMHKKANSFNYPLLPISDIFNLMEKLKITFGDLIISLLNEEKYEIQSDNDRVIFNNYAYNLIQDQQNNKGILGLAELAKLDKVKWNTENVINFLNSNPSIKMVYLTRKPDGIWREPWQKIMTNASMPGRDFISIYTPSAQGGYLHSQTNIYGKGKIIPLISHWLNYPHGRLDQNWVRKNGGSIND